MVFKNVRKKILSGFGSSLEWFDFAFYGYMGPVIAKVFFIDQAYLSSLISTYLVFAIGFLARPLGGVIFGYIGDKYGRLQALRLTPICITISTASIALLPSYQSIGFPAIIFLVILRFTQGIFLGGEYAGNIIYLCEASNKQHYLWGSVGSATASFGIILASATSYLLYNIFDLTSLINYGWRIGFLFSIPIGIFVYRLRTNMQENTYDSTCKNSTLLENHNPLKIIALSKKLFAIRCFGLTLHHAVSFYFVFMYLPILILKARNLPEASSLLNNTIFLILHATCIPMLGLVVNKVGGRNSLVLSCLALILVTQPVYYLILHGSRLSVYISLAILSLITAFNAAIIPGLLSAIIPYSIRYTLLALVLNISFGVLGGLTTAICLFLSKLDNYFLSPPNFVILFSIITLFFSFSINIWNGNEKIRRL